MMHNWRNSVCSHSSYKWQLVSKKVTIPFPLHFLTVTRTETSHKFKMFNQGPPRHNLSYFQDQKQLQFAKILKEEHNFKQKTPLPPHLAVNTADFFHTYMHTIIHHNMITEKIYKNISVFKD